MNWNRAWAVARNDLRQLRKSTDFWVPMLILAGVFFVLAPAFLLGLVTNVSRVPAVLEVANALGSMPTQDKAMLDAVTPQGQTAYLLAMFLFPPLAVIVPMTICTAIGANGVVGEREKGTGEFLAHSPATEREVFVGKLAASLLPGYAVAIIGFAIYSLIVNGIVGPELGRWFFPTVNWVVLVVWVIPPFLAITMSVVLRLSARVRSATAAQQASGLVTLPLIWLSYLQTSTFSLGVGSGFAIGCGAWVIAFYGLRRGAKAVTRERLLGVLD